MTAEKKVNVNLAKWEAWESEPRLNQLAQINESDVARIVAFMDKSEVAPNSCMQSLHMQYSLDMCLDYHDYDCANINLYNIVLEDSDKPKCYDRPFNPYHVDARCMKKMQQGKCQCPTGRELGAILWPEKYQGR